MVTGCLAPDKRHVPCQRAGSLVRICSAWNETIQQNHCRASKKLRNQTRKDTKASKRFLQVSVSCFWRIDLPVFLTWPAESCLWRKIFSLFLLLVLHTCSGVMFLCLEATGGEEICQEEGVKFKNEMSASPMQIVVFWWVCMLKTKEAKKQLIYTQTIMILTLQRICIHENLLPCASL